MDSAEASLAAHGDLRLWNPLSEAAVEEVVELLELAPGARVLDVACGRAELLRRVAERWQVEPRGYDSDPLLVEAAPAGLNVELRDTPPEGSFDLVICVASSHALGGFPDALRALRGLVVPGGQVLLGEGYWRQEPCVAYLDALGGASRDELPDYPGLMAAVAAAGLTPVHAAVASEQDWDRYEWRLILNAERNGHPVLLERAARARARVTMPGGREMLGFALVLLQANREAQARV